MLYERTCLALLATVQLYLDSEHNTGCTCAFVVLVGISLRGGTKLAGTRTNRRQIENRTWSPQGSSQMALGQYVIPQLI